MNAKQITLNLIQKENIDGILYYSHDNRYWYSRFASSLGYLLVCEKGSFLFLDGRYITAAMKKQENKQLTNIDEIIWFKNALVDINEKIKELGIKRLGFESDWIFYNQFEEFKKAFSCSLNPVNTFKIREVKCDWEVEQIKKACDITKIVFDDVLSYVKPGLTEIELARFVSDSFLKNGANKLSFDTIVASGENGSMPHAVPTHKVMEDGDMITLDMGCYFNGYCSDQTRTFSLGTPSNKLKEIYQIVYEAQQAGIDAVKPGVITGDIHKICFDYIESKGYGQYFTHGTGHGIGTQIHEEPYNAKNQETVLQENMCITVEPGIYIPGVGGVRIEDDILVTKEGHKFLTSSPRELISIK